MAKYIDADKLIAEIERRLKSLHEWKTGWERRLPLSRNKTYYKNFGKESAYDAILNIITSLRQEQENVAERFARIVCGNLIGINKEVQQKFEQLYFEVTRHKMYGGFKDQPYTKEKEK